MTMVKSSNPHTQNRGNQKWWRTFFKHPVPCLYIYSYALSPKHYPFPLTLTDSDPPLPIAKYQPRTSHRPLWLTPSRTLPTQLIEPSRLTCNFFLINPKDFYSNLSCAVVHLWIQNHKCMWFYLELGCDFRFDRTWKLIIVIF